MSMEQIFRVDRLATDFGIEIKAAGSKTTCSAKIVYIAEIGIINIRGELVGIPAEEQITSVCINRAKQTIVGGKLKFMLESMARRRGCVVSALFGWSPARYATLAVIFLFVSAITVGHWISSRHLVASCY